MRPAELKLAQQGTVDRTPEPGVPDLVETLRQHMLQKAASTLPCRQGHGPNRDGGSPGSGNRPGQPRSRACDYGSARSGGHTGPRSGVPVRSLAREQTEAPNRPGQGIPKDGAAGAASTTAMTPAPAGLEARCELYGRMLLMRLNAALWPQRRATLWLKRRRALNRLQLVR
jgi:hypothetical protein